jgi:hypothetical protein
LRVALVGYGFAGRVFHAPLIAGVEGMQLSSIVSSRTGAVHADWPEVTVHPDLSGVLADPAIDLVVLATPNTLHASQAHAALDAAKHVVVDKPFTVTVPEAEAVVAHAERAGRVVSVFQNRRWDADFLTLRRLIAEGALGEVTYFESRFDRFRPVDVASVRLGGCGSTGTARLTGRCFARRATSADHPIQRAECGDHDYFHVWRYARLRVVLHASTLVAANDLRLPCTGGSYVKHGVTAETHSRPGQAGRRGWGRTQVPVLPLADGARACQARSREPGDSAYYEAVGDAIAGRA